MLSIGDQKLPKVGCVYVGYVHNQARGILPRVILYKEPAASFAGHSYPHPELFISYVRLS